MKILLKLVWREVLPEGPIVPASNGEGSWGGYSTHGRGLEEESGDQKGAGLGRNPFCGEQAWFRQEELNRTLEGDTVFRGKEFFAVSGFVEVSLEPLDVSTTGGFFRLTIPTGS